ncbi:MAG: DUF2786 domain-containing protein [Acidimicrobiales bacterium]
MDQNCRPRVPVLVILGGVSRDGLVSKVAALLAKADSTEHEPEREAFLAKAQALITRYQIEDGELRLNRTDMLERSIMVERWGNATRGVVHLYSGVAELNRCSVAHRTGRGWAKVVLFGTDIDAELTCALVDHLLPQLRLAILNDRPRSRMSYSIGWTHEVLERLKAARETEAAISNALVPTNLAADEALRAAHSLRSERRKTVDSAEYGSGMVAGEQADIGRTGVGQAPTPELG